ncbi:unnamed protein product [Staurois parvus]|uniref:Ig-like domain-containing protein n=1 Tax=Staurois parvus TaxID=386267 RepID=A0ABN9FCP1_9NEOB|nr:unnamed protein product [Staurois parvus]
MCIHLLVLALCLTPCLPQSILQTPPMIVVSPGQPVKLNCTSTATGDPYMYWYRQPMTRGALVFIVLSVSKGSVEELTLKHFKAERRKDKEAEFTLESDEIQAEDAGLYYCAWSITDV